MSLEELEKAIKTALLSGNKIAVNTFKGLKSALQYEAVAKKKKLEDLSPEDIQAVIKRELKKRQEAASLYKQGGNTEKSNTELKEAKLLEPYLPQQLSEQELTDIVNVVVSELLAGKPATAQDMGRLIGAVKQRAGANADGATVAQLVKSYIEGHS